MSELEEQKIVDTLEETDKKCPQCDGVMEFDPKTGDLRCPYCEYTEAIKIEDTTPKKAKELDFFDAKERQNCDWRVNKKTVICDSCGAESIYDALEIASVCPFCGSNQVMEANDKDTMAPGGVVPFQISDKEAAELFQKWIKKKWFCPKLAKESAKAKSFKGVYFPYWTFDTTTQSSYTAKYGKDRRVRRGDKTVIETDWYTTSGNHNEFINDELVLASTTHDQAMLRGLEPFNTEDNKGYKPEYLAGFTAQRYSVGLEDAWEKAKQLIKRKLENSISKKVRREKHADRVGRINLSTTYSDITYKYLLLPVWLSTFKYQDKVYQFMVNGQTGKVSGKTPISVFRVLLAIFIAILILGGLYFLNNS